MEDKERMLGIKDIMNAVEITLYSDTVLYIVDENDDAYGFYKIDKKWIYKQNYYDYFDSSLMLQYFKILTPEEAVELYEQWMNE